MMSYFKYRGPIAPESQLFRGRERELARLTNMCQRDIDSYAIVYGGRQMGKTSLLLRLQASLPKSINICQIDFQSLPGAGPIETYKFIANRIARQYNIVLEESEISNSSALIDFLCKILEQMDSRLVLLFDELGALPVNTRQDLANVLRSMFSNRMSTYSALGELMVIIVGSIELYDLAVTDVSTLHNVCESIYLSDLSKEETIGLVVDGLIDSGMNQDSANDCGEWVFKKTDGHVYLTQRLGSEITIAFVDHGIVSPPLFDELIVNLLDNESFFLQIKHSVYQHDLTESCKDLLNGDLKFSRMDEDIAKLELLGVSKSNGKTWEIRNSMIKQSIASWVTEKENYVPKKTAMNNNTPKIFISSTWKDLRDEREAIEKAMHRMSGTDFSGMEYFGSRTETPREISLLKVDESNIYIGVFGHRYGSGITEDEYRRARELDLPCFIYMKDTDVPVLLNQTETDAKKMAKLQSLKKELHSSHTVSVFNTPDHLASLIVADIHNFMTG